jgi:hypothetical protein
MRLQVVEIFTWRAYRINRPRSNDRVSREGGDPNLEYTPEFIHASELFISDNFTNRKVNTDEKD